MFLQTYTNIYQHRSKKLFWAVYAVCAIDLNRPLAQIYFLLVGGIGLVLNITDCIYALRDDENNEMKLP